MDPADPYRAPPEGSVADEGPMAPRARLLAFLRGLIVAHPIGYLLYVAIVFYLPENLPDGLLEYRDAYYEGAPGALVWFELGSLALLMVALVGCWLPRRWAAWLYLALGVFATLTSLLHGPSITAEPERLVADLLLVLEGLTLATLYALGAFARPANLERAL